MKTWFLGILTACFAALAVASASGCELAVQLDPALADASISDACPICADVASDANYDVVAVEDDAGADAGDDGGADATLPAEGGSKTTIDASADAGD
jgi:hypothetical protein